MLQWQCGTTIGVAREKVRVARALPKLPKISKSFSKGPDQLLQGTGDDQGCDTEE